MKNTVAKVRLFGKIASGAEEKTCFITLFKILKENVTFWITLSSYQILKKLYMAEKGKISVTFVA